MSERRYTASHGQDNQGIRTKKVKTTRKETKDMNQNLSMCLNIHGTLLAGLMATSLNLYAADLTLGHKDFVPNPQHPVGWRGDGTGVFPGATPPTAWDAAKGDGVRWKTPLPGISESSAIVVGKKVFAAGSPHLLYCLDADTGAILWQRDADPVSVLAPGQEAALRTEQTEVVAQVKAAGGKPDKTLAQRAAILARKGLVTKELSYHGFFSLSAPTPTSDGKRVYVQFPAGVLVAWDLDGKELWKVPAQPDGWAMGNSSPVVCQGNVLASTGKRGGPTLLCIEAATGKTRWSAEFPTADHCGSGSPAMARTAVGWKVVTPVNKLFDLDTGAEWFSHPYFTAIGATPLVDGSHVLLMHGDYHEKSRQLAIVDFGGTQPIATAYPRQSSGNITGSPLVVDGKVYLPDGDGLTPEIIGLADGKALVVPDRKTPLAPPPLVKGEGWFSPSPAFAGGHIYQATRDGRVLVIALATPLKVLAVNSLAPMNGSPFFQGDRIYFRTREGVWCIGKPASKGK
jgi:outer membrane protein assembly factor BamB